MTVHEKPENRCQLSMMAPPHKALRSKRRRVLSFIAIFLATIYLSATPDTQATTLFSFDNSLEDSLICPIVSTGRSQTTTRTQDAEHDAMLALVKRNQATSTSVRSGNWSDPQTWGGTLPAANGRIVVAAGHTVTVDQQFADSYMTVRVDGTMQFATNANTELRVDTVVVDPSGTFLMGTASNPIQSNVTAKLVIDDLNNGFETQDSNSPDYDPRKLGQGLLAHGRTEIHGAVKTGNATTNGASAGDVTITLDVRPNDWAVGDTVVIAGSNRDGTGEEVRTISSLQGARKIRLDQPLSNDHQTPAHSKSGLTLKVHVINTTRNAVIETAPDHRDDFVNGTSGPQRFAKEFVGRGHVLFMHSNDAEVRYAGFYFLGRTNKQVCPTCISLPTPNAFNPIARYALHFHRAGSDVTPAIVHGSAVVDSPGWGFVNHSSSVDMTDNVAYDTRGAAFVSEAGDEVGSFVGNVAIKTHGNGVENRSATSAQGARHLLNFGSAGDGYWIHSQLVNVRDNVASGFTGSGYHFWNQMIDGVAETDQVDKKFSHDPELVTGNTVAMPDTILFEDNVAYAGAIGFNASFNLINEEDYHLINRFLVYGVDTGIHRKYSHNFVVHDLVAIGSLSDPQGEGVSARDNSSSFDLINAHIEGFESGVEFAERGNPTAVSGGYFNNVHNITVNIRDDRAQHVTIRGNVRFGQLSGQALAGRTQYNFYGVKTGNSGDPDSSTYIIDLDSMNSPARARLAQRNSGQVPNGYFNLVLQTVTENTINPPLFRKDYIPNQTIQVGTTQHTIDLASAFVDPLDRPISYSIASNSNAGLVGTTIQGTQLVLNLDGQSTGSAIITVRGETSRDQKVDAFLVVIESGNGAPPTPTSTPVSTNTPAPTSTPPAPTSTPVTTNTPAPTNTPPSATSTPAPTATPVSGQRETLFSDDFESGTLTAGGWSINGSSEIAGEAGYEGSYGARVKHGGDLSKALNTSGYEAIEVSFVRNTVGLVSPEKLIVEWSADGGTTWTTLETTRQTTWRQKTFGLPAAAENNANFVLRFNVESDKNAEKGLIDNVVITGIALGAQPTPTSTPPTQSQELFRDDFESGTLTAGGWTIDGSAEIAGEGKYEGQYGARIKWGGDLSKSLDTNGYSNIAVSYVRKTSELVGAEKLIVEWSADGGTTWTMLETTQQTNWAEKVFNLPSSADNNPNFILRFNVESNRNAEKALIDNVVITSNASRASNPTTVGLLATTAGGGIRPMLLITFVVVMLAAMLWLLIYPRLIANKR